MVEIVLGTSSTLRFMISILRMEETKGIGYTTFTCFLLFLCSRVYRKMALKSIWISVMTDDERASDCIAGDADTASDSDFDGDNV